MEWDDAKAVENPDDTLRKAIRNHEVVVEARKRGFYFCTLENGKIESEMIEDFSEISEVLPDFSELVNEHNHLGSDHRIYALTEKEWKVIEYFKKSHSSYRSDYKTYSRKGLNGVLERYEAAADISGKENSDAFFEMDSGKLSDSKFPSFDYRNLMCEIGWYSAEHSCDAKEALFALMIEDEKFKNKFVKFITRCEEQAEKYNTYKDVMENE